MDLGSRLQIKPGMSIAVLARPAGGPDLTGSGPVVTDPAAADVVIAFARERGDLTASARPAIEAARQDRIAWVAYPKAGQLGTDLNRDSLAKALAGHGIRPVRQIAIDDVWSALRFRPGSRD